MISERCHGSVRQRTDACPAGEYPELHSALMPFDKREAMSLINMKRLRLAARLPKLSIAVVQPSGAQQLSALSMRAVNRS